MDALPAQKNHVSYDQLSLDLPGDLSLDEWSQIGQQLCRAQQTANWLIGDWWAAGQHRYGERAKLAAQGIFGREFQTLANYASVCRSFETSRRREALSFNAHETVAALAPEEADKMLDKATAEKLSVRELRVHVMRHRVRAGDFVEPFDDDPDHTSLLTIARAWNRATRDVRETFASLVAESDYGEIDP